MFTGIIQQVGRVEAMRENAFGASLAVDPGDWVHRPVPGESIAVSGCCLTLVRADGAARGESDRSPLEFDIVRQTLDVTALGALRAGEMVNLEHAATPTTLLGGHIVQGHVDGVGTVSRVDRDETEWRVRIEPPPGLAEVIVERGSIAVDGVSLTIAAAGADEASGAPWFEVALIPTTLKLTTLGALTPGRGVNLEGDYVAKIVVNWLQRAATLGAPGPG